MKLKYKHKMGEKENFEVFGIYYMKYKKNT